MEINENCELSKENLCELSDEDLEQIAAGGIGDDILNFFKGLFDAPAGYMRRSQDRWRPFLPL